MTSDEAKQVLAEYRPMFLKVATRIVRANGIHPDDAVQEAYVRALRAVEAGNFPREREHLLAWFTRIAHNAAFDARRCLARRKDGTTAPDHAEPADDQPGPLDQLIGRDANAEQDRSLVRLRGLIDELPAEERQAVVLRFQGMPSRGIAAALGIPAGSVSAVFRSAYRKLRRGLGESDPFA